MQYIEMTVEEAKKCCKRMQGIGCYTRFSRGKY